MLFPVGLERPYPEIWAKCDAGIAVAVALPPEGGRDGVASRPVAAGRR